MKVIVVGGGKVGFYLAQTLMNHGHKPFLIEKSKSLCAELANKLDIPVICGDGSTIESLELAGASEADSLIGVTGQDQDNLIACQLGKKRFNIPKTIARVNNPKNVEIMKLFGVDIAISSTDNIAKLLEREVDTAAIKQLLAINSGEASISELFLPNDYKFDGKTLIQLKLPETYVIVSIIRDGKLIIPRGNTQVCSGDKVIVLCDNSVVHDLSKILDIE
ncbi:MAG: NAD-binding protein [Oscillospiraceae bacterium]